MLTPAHQLHPHPSSLSSAYPAASKRCQSVPWLRAVSIDRSGGRSTRQVGPHLVQFQERVKGALVSPSILSIPEVEDTNEQPHSQSTDLIVYQLFSPHLFHIYSLALARAVCDFGPPVLLDQGAIRCARPGSKPLERR